ncbi:MAG TPA: hypothetical protein VGE01_08125 [Fimbriimonas sp.]
MTAKELLQFQLDDAGYQLDQVLSGFPEGSAGNSLGMTPMQTLSHLGEAYVATSKQARGEKHDWGTFQLDAATFEEALEKLRSLRADAISTVLSGNDDALRAGHAFIVAHDYYHVGQLCAQRLRCEPDWDAYSIYR